MSGDTFYMAYTTSYNYLDGSTNMTAKHLYLRKGTIDTVTGAVTPGDPVLLYTIVDSEDDDKDGVYSGAVRTEKFTDPFFGGLEFLKGRLDPDSSIPENFLLFNMNNRYYVIDEECLCSFIDGDPKDGKVTPFFELESGEQGDNKGDFSVGVDGNGNISAVYTSPVPFTNNNAIYFTKYDPDTGTWGRGVMLAMRGMATYERAEEEGWTEETIKAEFFKDDYKLIFQKPRVVMSTSGALQLVSQTVMTELEEMDDPMSDDPAITVKIPKKTSEGFTLPSAKGFYAMSFPAGKRLIGSPSLTFDTKTFVPGAVLAPRISFKNVGDFALRGSEEKPLLIKLMLGDLEGDAADLEIAEWKVTTNVPSGERVDTLMDSKNEVYGQIGTKVFADPLPADLDGKFLYFTVNEDASYGDAFGFNSLDPTGSEGSGKRGIMQQSLGSMGTRAPYYSTNQNKAELALDAVSVKQGGGIVTVNGRKYMPLDIEVTVSNYSELNAAADVRLNVTYRQTDQQGEKPLPAGAKGTNGTVLSNLVTSAQNRQVQLQFPITMITKRTKPGAYFILTDGNLDPILPRPSVPLTWFDANSSDRSWELPV